MTCGRSPSPAARERRASSVRSTPWWGKEEPRCPCASPWRAARRSSSTAAVSAWTPSEAEDPEEPSDEARGANWAPGTARARLPLVRLLSSALFWRILLSSLLMVGVLGFGLYRAGRSHEE